MNATFRLFFLIITCVTWTARASYAAQIDEAKHQQNTKSSEERGRHRASSVKNQPHRGANAAKSNSSSAASGEPGNSIGVRRQVSNKPRDGANMARSGAPDVSMTRVGRHPTVPQASIPGLSTVHHRSANPASVGGAASPNTKSTGAISGTHVNRKP